MAYYIKDGKKISITSMKNHIKRCMCDGPNMVYIENPIYLALKEGKEPQVFNSKNEPLGTSKYLERAISFKGCICELEMLSDSYRIIGARTPSQYNYRCCGIVKETGDYCLGVVPVETQIRWEGRRR